MHEVYICRPKEMPRIFFGSAIIPAAKPRLLLCNMSKVNNQSIVVYAFTHATKTISDTIERHFDYFQLFRVRIRIRKTKRPTLKVCAH